MKITFNSDENLKSLQKSIACFEESMLLLLGEETELSIVFDEAVEDKFGCQLFLHYTIYSWCNELIKTASFNIAR